MKQKLLNEIEEIQTTLIILGKNINQLAAVVKTMPESHEERPQDIRDLPPMKMIEEITHTSTNEKTVDFVYGLRDFMIARGYLTTRQMESLVETYKTTFP